MDDDLLADDGQYKDDGLDDLDIDEEAALLGLSDEEIENDRITGDQELEYVDEDGNPVEIGENNAEQYEVAKYDYDDKDRGTPTEDDVLDLELDTELDSFTEEDSDLFRESPMTFKKDNERQCKDNLISLTSRDIKRQDSRQQSPDMGSGKIKTEHLYQASSSVRRSSTDTFNLKLEYDEESEDDEEVDHRERFKSERSNIITLTPAKNRDIPDTLESVINAEEEKKVQAFLENEQKRKMRYKGNRNNHQMNRNQRYGRQNQNFNSPQHHQPPVFTSPAPVPQQQQFQAPAGPPQPQKILINPHFRGPRPQLDAELGVIANPNPPQVSTPQPQYNQPHQFNQPVNYTQDHHQANLPPPAYSAPPPAMPQYQEFHTPPQQHMQHPPPQHMQQNIPPVWQNPPPEMHQPQVSYANQPPPHMNYGEPIGHSPGYHNNNYSPNNYQNAAYSPPQMQPPPQQMPPPQNISYSQPPHTIHHHQQPSGYTQASQSSNMHFQNSQPVQQQNIQQKPRIEEPRQFAYQEQRNTNQQPQRNVNQQPQQNFNQQQSQNFMRNNNAARNQPFNRVAEKRASNVAVKQVPKKQPRLEHPQRKNVHVNSSNIREIPLVDTVKKPIKVVSVKREGNKPAAEDEDEKTRELRMKIEEQKLLREQILKRKEERRRQMAAQRLMDMQQRQQSEQKSNVISVPRVEQKVPIQAPTQTAAKPKANVRERIGIPGVSVGQGIKKKIVVVRKKVQPVTNVAPAQQNKVTIAQRLGNQTVKQTQPQKKTVVTNAPPKPKQSISQPIQQKTITTTTVKKPQPPTKNLATAAAKKIIAKTKTNIKNNKGNILNRLGNRGFANRPMRPMAAPRFNGPRQPPPFLEHRGRFPGPMNDGPMRPPFHDHGPPFDRRPLPFQDQGPPPFDHRPFDDHGPPPFERRLHPGPPPFDDRPFDDCGPPPFDRRPPPFENQRPPLLPFGERPPFDHPRFRMERPGFRPPMRMDFPDRFPRPQFRPQFDQGPMFQRPRFQGPNQRQRFNNPQKKQGPGVKSSPTKPDSSQSPTRKGVTVKKEINEDVPTQQKQSENKPLSVCVENLSSSTNAVQLKKLCSSVGVVENIQLIKDERKAVIIFKEPSHAVNFQKKFQRHMLDLAMIQVSLIHT